MEPHVIVLDAKRDQEFLKQQRKDPVIKVLLKAGDRVVVCAHCRSVFLEETWAEIKGRRFEHGFDTLPELPVDPVAFSRAGTAAESSAPQPAETAHAAPGAAPFLRTESPNAAPPPPAPAYEWPQVTRQPPNRDHQRSNETGERRTERPRPATETQRRVPLFGSTQPSNDTHRPPNNTIRPAPETPQPRPRLANQANRVVDRARLLFDNASQRSNRSGRRWPWERAPQPASDVGQRDSGSLTLKEIPFELREVPFKLRETRY